MSITVFVTYQGTAESRFDRDYYLTKHLPLVLSSWEKYGFEGSTAFFPLEVQSGTIVVCELRFRDEAALATALTSNEAPAVMSDIHNYTDISAEFTRPTPLQKTN